MVGLNRIVVTLLITLAACLAAVPGNASVRADVAMTVPGHVGLIATDGAYLVWQPEEEPILRARRLPDGPVVEIGSAVANLQVANGLAIWSAQTGGDDASNLDIHGYNLVTGEAYPIATSTADERDPQLSGTLVAWTELSDDGTSMDILARDLTTGQRFEVATTSADETRPLLSGSRVVWQQDDGTTASILTRDLAAGDEVTTLLVIPLTERPADGVWSIWLADLDANRLAWIETHGPDTGYGYSVRNVIMTMQLDAPRPVQIGIDNRFERFRMARVQGDVIVYALGNYSSFAWDASSGTATFLGYGANNPVTDGRYVLWGGRFVNFDGPGDLVLTDLWTGSETTIAHAIDAFAFVAVDHWILWSIWDGENTTIHVSRVEDLLPSAPEPAPGSSGQDWVYFPETHHSLHGAFYDYWTNNGGLPVFGYPTTREFRERSIDTGVMYTVQFTERQRFESHPENAGTAYEVLLGRLGAELLRAQGRDWMSFDRADPADPYYMAETGHAVAPEFWDYWSMHGLDLGDPDVSFRESLALFGYPLSEPMIESNADGDTVLTQYFERAVFEYHPDNPVEWQVLLRRLGVEMLEQRGWYTT